ncbi:hypothetical protein ABPG72_014531 [Tetrahymena utriculariae]
MNLIDFVEKVIQERQQQKQNQFQLALILNLVLWIIIFSYFGDTINEETIQGLIFIFFLVIFVFDKLLQIHSGIIFSNLPQIQQLVLNMNFQNTQNLIEKHVLLFKAFDKIPCNHVKLVLLIFQGLSFAQVQIFVSCFNYFYSCNSNQGIFYYISFIASIILLTMLSNQLIQSFSQYSRYNACKTRNVLKYIFVFCSIFVQLQIQIFLPNRILGYAYPAVQSMIQVACTYQFISNINNLLNQQIQILRRFIQTLFIFLMGFLNLEVFIFPLYNKAISGYYTNACQGFRLYLFTIQRLINLVFAIYIINTENFQQQTFYTPALLISITFIVLNSSLIIYQLFFHLNSNTKIISLLQILNNQVNQNSSQNEFQIQLLPNNIELIEQFINKIQKNSLILQISDQQLTINIDNQFVQSNIQDYEDLEDNSLIQTTFQAVLNSNNKSNLAIRITQNRSDWLLKEGNNLYFLLSSENIDFFTQFLQKYNGQQLFELTITFTEQIPQQAQELLVRALTQQLFTMKVQISQFNNVVQPSNLFIYYIQNQQNIVQQKMAQILAINKNIIQFQQYSQQQILYDLYD